MIFREGGSETVYGGGREERMERCEGVETLIEREKERDKENRVTWGMESARRI